MADALHTMVKHLSGQVSSVGINDIIDIFIVAVQLYYIFRFVRDRRASKLALGVVLLFILYLLSDFFKLMAVKFIMDNILQVGLIAVLIVFQPELRSMLESFAGQTRRFKMIGSKPVGENEAMINELCSAASDLSKDRTGALILIQRNTPLGDYAKSGSIINADVSSILLRNLFFNKSPLHDGAVIIKNGRIQAAGCFLPLSMNPDIIKELGTRHRAAIGASENSDAVVIVVSEETGTISVAKDGHLMRDFDEQSLKTYLEGQLNDSAHRRSKGVLSFAKKAENGEADENEK